MGLGDGLPVRVRRSDRAPALSEREASMDPDRARGLAHSSSLGVAQHRLPLALLGARWPDPLGALMQSRSTPHPAAPLESLFQHGATLALRGRVCDDRDASEPGLSAH